ncbi:hypothetical protein ACFYKX_10770 [Cytobacillus sp. FJAT-54145]|uniref:Uncharacterized protein n=1 Tax=Cytobacillus spartinae TaxID=3299023 RepID=A0ABW6KBX2_9BACI
MTQTILSTTTLDLQTACRKKHPIREAAQLTKPLHTKPMSQDWLNTIAERNHFWYTGFQGKLEDQFRPERIEHAKQLLEMRERLLTFGGEQVCLPAIEEDLDAILNRGQLWYGDRSHLVKGRDSRCHENACNLYEANQNNPLVTLHMATGYALTEDGMWRQHSWLIQERPRVNRVIETTVKRIAYFGFVMTKEEAEEFCYNNY